MTTKPEMHSPRLTDTQQALVVESRERGVRVASAIARRWGSTIGRDELQSIVDESLCEAALRFDQGAGTDFLTYGWYFIQGGIRKHITASVGFPTLLSDTEVTSCSEEHRHLQSSDHEHREAYQHLSSTLRTLPVLHRRVFVKASVLGHKVAAVARELGYSRPHLSEVHQKALRQVRRAMLEYKTAA